MSLFHLVVFMFMRICIAFNLHGCKAGLWIDSSLVFSVTTPGLHLLLDQGESARISGGKSGPWTPERRSCCGLRRVRALCVERAQVLVKWGCSLKSWKDCPLILVLGLNVLFLWIQSNSAFSQYLRGMTWPNDLLYLHLCTFTVTVSDTPTAHRNAHTHAHTQTFRLSFHNDLLSSASAVC